MDEGGRVQRRRDRSGEQRQPSRLTKNALVADTASDDLDELNEHPLLDPQEDPGDWVNNLARQLGMKSPAYETEPYETLLFLVREIDPLLRAWPLPKDPNDCEALVRSAIGTLRPVELVRMLWLGPSRWRNAKISEGRISALPDKLRSELERTLASALSALFTRSVAADLASHVPLAILTGLSAIGAGGTLIGVGASLGTFTTSGSPCQKQ